MKQKYALILVSILLVGASICEAQTKAKSANTRGPKKGSLVIVGGGKPVPRIMEKFIELAGGPDVPMVVIPTAAGRDSYDEGWGNILKNAGATNVTVLHTSDKSVANSDEFVTPLKNAKGVWFGGGRQWRLVDSYAGTQAEELFWEVLKKGGAIGGSSAGATIQGSYLARGDTKNNQIMMGDHEEGFGFIKNIAIDQHVLARGRHFDLFAILKSKPELLGVGLDEQTGIVVSGNTFEVVGESYVLMYDGTFWSREGSSLKTLPSSNTQFYFLREGDKYDLKKRKVID